jgi:hypothetical protein
MRLTTEVVGVRGSRSALWPTVERLADEAVTRVRARIERIGFRLTTGWYIGPVDANHAETFLRETFAELIAAMDPEDVGLAVQAMRASCALIREPDERGVRVVQAMTIVQRGHNERTAPLKLPPEVARSYAEGYADAWTQTFVRCGDCDYAFPQSLGGPCPLCGAATKWEGTPFRDMGPPEEALRKPGGRNSW